MSSTHGDLVENYLEYISLIRVKSYSWYWPYSNNQKDIKINI